MPNESNEISTMIESLENLYNYKIYYSKSEPISVPSLFSSCLTLGKDRSGKFFMSDFTNYGYYSIMIYEDYITISPNYIDIKFYHCDAHKLENILHVINDKINDDMRQKLGISFIDDMFKVYLKPMKLDLDPETMHSVIFGDYEKITERIQNYFNHNPLELIIKELWKLECEESNESDKEKLNDDMKGEFE